MTSFKLLARNLLYPLLFIVLSNKALAQKTFFEPVYDPTLDQTSYFIGDLKTKQAIVIDAKRDIDTYLAIAEQNGFTITSVSETYIHEDFVSGSRELQAKTGAKLYLSDEGAKEDQYQFAHIGLHDGDKISVGATVLKVMHTPGYTTESISFLIQDNNILKALTGDFLLVKDLGGAARQFYQAIKQFSKFADNTEIWAGHGAISSPRTLAKEKEENKVFKLNEDQLGFVNGAIPTANVPLPYFSKVRSLNKSDRSLLTEVPKYKSLSKQEFKEALFKGVQVIDTRAKEIVNQGFIRGAINMEDGAKFQTFVGSLLSYDKPIVLIVEQEKLNDITRKLMRIGIDYVFGYVSDITALDLPIEKSKVIGINEFKEFLADKDRVQMIDVRSAAEFQQGHIRGEENIPLDKIAQNLEKISKDKPVILHCQSGTRATIAHSILSKQGYNNLIIYLGGVNDWIANGGELIHK